MKRNNIEKRVKPQGANKSLSWNHKQKRIEQPARGHDECEKQETSGYADHGADLCGHVQPDSARSQFQGSDQ